MADDDSRQKLRLGLLLFAGMALAFAVATFVIGNHLDHLDVSFAAQGRELAHQRLHPGDAGFSLYRWLWRGAMGLGALVCAGFAFGFWRALSRPGRATDGS